MQFQEMLKEEREEGREEGRQEGKSAMIYDLIREDAITMEKGAEKLGISMTELQEQIKKLSYTPS